MLAFVDDCCLPSSPSGHRQSNPLGLSMQVFVPLQGEFKHSLMSFSSQNGPLQP